MGKKVVLDTNIFISALGWKGKPRQIFQKCINDELELVTSPQQISELVRVMGYPKFNFTQEEKDTFVSIILEIARLVYITEKVKVIKEDPDDDIILETASVGNVDYIVSGDPHLLRLKEFGKVKMITANEFLEIIE